MIGTEAKVTMYNVRHCGYYSQRGQKFEFCNVEKTLSDLSSWAHNKSVLDTKLFAGTPQSAQLAVYLFDARRLAKGWLLTFWNQTSPSEGRVTSVAGGAKVGTGKISAVATKTGDIPGYPSYYWFSPAKQAAASLRFFNHPSNHAGMQRYMQSFLSYASPHAVIAEGQDDPEIDGEILGYVKDPDGAISTTVEPYFRALVMRHGGEIDYIKKHCATVRKILRKTKLDKARRTSMEIWQRALAWAHLNRPVDPPKGVRIQYSVNVRGLVEDDIERMAQAWNSESGPNGTWDDYGFVMAGDQKVYWLGGSFVRDTLHLDVTFDPDTSVVAADSLVTALDAKHSSLLRLIP